MDSFFPIAIGVLFSLAVIAFARSWGPHRELLIYGLGLGTPGAIYMGFAVACNAYSSIPMELLDAGFFGGLGALGIWRWPAVLAVGWAGHVAWDLLVVKASVTRYAPDYLPALCIGFDLFLAGYIAGMVWPGRNTPS